MSPTPLEENLYLNGQWTESESDARIEVIDPSTEEVLGRVSAGTAGDVDRAVLAAGEAFETWSRTSREERAEFLDKIAQGLRTRGEEIGDTIAREMGMPVKLARMIQAGLPPRHFSAYAELIRTYDLFEDRGTTRIVREPIGVCAFITPWNYPLHQIAGKVAPALAAGCTMVLKPSEIAPLNAVILAEVIHAVGLPAGVFNLVHGEGPIVGAALAAHPGVDMVSFTGSTRAGVAVAQAAAATVKRVTQELGGKSPNLLLDDVDLEKAVAGGVKGCFSNSGQACNAPTRMLVPEELHDRAVEIARQTAESLRPGPAMDPETTLGPLVSAAQYDKVRRLIEIGIEEGAELVAGGPDRPEGLEKGYFVKPTVFARVDNQMTIAREEIFGPVLSILPYKDLEEAVRIANDTDYGLSAYVMSGDPERAKAVASRLRAGQVHLNGARFDANAPFGGYKQSGNGREFGTWGLEEYFETKALLGYHSS